jgi:RNA polymerase sigma-70 factor (sigma-E family)
MRSRNKDEQFSAFFRAESDRLQRFAVLMTGEPDLAAELTQEALARVYRSWGRIEGGDAGPYTRRVIVNLFRSELRRRMTRRARPHLHAVPAAVPSKSKNVDDYVSMTEALKQLSPIRRATILLRFYEDMTEAQIAEVLDRPLGTVKSDIHRALAQLRPKVEEMVGGAR